MNDSYRILGVSSAADAREVRRAYRDMKRKYRPRPFGDPKLRRLARERQRQICNAYRDIRRNEAGRESGTVPRQGENPYQSRDPFLCSEARAMIKKGEFASAERLLHSAEASLRNAEWHYLMGLVLRHRNCYLDAQRMLESACRIDPLNEEYRAAKQTLAEQTNEFGRGYRLSKSVHSDKTSEFCCECCGALACEGCCECICEGICSGLG